MPRTTVEESASMPSLFSVTIDNFDPRLLVLSALDSPMDSLQTILDNRIGAGTPFKLKVVVEWEVVFKASGEDQTSQYFMAFTAFNIPPSMPFVFGQLTSFPMGPFMEGVRQRAFDKTEWAEGQGSDVRFVRIIKIVFTAVPLQRTALTEGLGGCLVKLPPSLANKHAVVNVANTDNMCFIYAVMAWALDRNNPYNPHRVTSYYSNAPVVRAEFLRPLFRNSWTLGLISACLHTPWPPLVLATSKK